MAKNILYVEQFILNLLSGGQGTHHFETGDYYYLPIAARQIELVSSPRPTSREHFRRDFTAALEDLETAVRHLGYMKSEI